MEDREPWRDGIANSEGCVRGLDARRLRGRSVWAMLVGAVSVGRFWRIRLWGIALSKELLRDRRWDGMGESFEKYP